MGVHPRGTYIRIRGEIHIGLWYNDPSSTDAMSKLIPERQTCGEASAKSDYRRVTIEFAQRSAAHARREIFKYGLTIMETTYKLLLTFPGRKHYMQLFGKPEVVRTHQICPSTNVVERHAR